MGHNQKDNQIHWERHQKRTKKGERIRRKQASAQAQFLRNLCRATEHTEDAKGYKHVAFSDDWSHTIVTYTCSRCNSQVSRKEARRVTYTIMYGSTRTGRIKSSGTS